MNRTIEDLEFELDAAEAELVRYRNAVAGYRTFEESGVEAVRRMHSELAATKLALAVLVLARAQFLASLNERIAELQAQRDRKAGITRDELNGRIGLIQAIKHDFERISNDTAK